MNFEEIEKGFKDPNLARKLVHAISRNAGEKSIRLMEVCGTHTVSIARAGIKSLLPSNVDLISGPGCPVCVTSNEDIDKVIALSKMEGVIIATFGDMARVPGSSTTLLEQKAEGASVEVCYSPLDALKIAENNPEKEVVFVGVGFETTTPLVAATIKRAKENGVDNFSVFVAHKNMPGAIETIVKDAEVKVDGLILPGHVSTIIGLEPYEFLAKNYSIPGVVTGFEPVDILSGIEMLTRQIANGEAKIENAYSRNVEREGNSLARSAIDEVFEVCDAKWRGLGQIKGSGFALKEEFSKFDAEKKFNPIPEATKEHKGCACAEVLRGKISPNQCPLFRKVCTPQNPVGPCMVSNEGSCAAYYKYY